MQEAKNKNPVCAAAASWKLGVISFFASRFDSEGQLQECASISNTQGGPAAGGNTNWKTLYEAKSENLGQGDKVKRGLETAGVGCFLLR